MPRDELMSLAELATIATAFVDLGVRKIRLTGGEPLVRPDVVSLVAKLSSLPGLDELTLTTNGAHLHKLAQPLKQAGLSRINISLDSLQPDRFKQLTRTGKLADVLAGIRAAQDVGFTRIKLNSVILRDRNDDEVIDLVDFARAQGLDIAFIEEMPLGVIHEHDRAASFVSSAEILARIGTRIGVISPHSANFCSTCNRVRVTAGGKLMLCLGNDDAVDLGAVLRAHPHAPSRLKEAIKAAIQTKPERHHFRLDAPPQIIRFMNMTGG